MADNEDMYEKFEVTDYDLENEFNINRPRRKLTKNQQIYGIWDDGDDDDEEERSKRSQKNLKDVKNKRYKGPVSFVSASTTADPSPSSSFRMPMNKEEEEEDDEDNYRPSFGKRNFVSVQDAMEETAGIRTTANRNRLNAHDPEFCKWEKHTTGIGSKLLLQMGFQPGKGLGKNLQGIATPIQAKARLDKSTVDMKGNATMKTKESSTTTRINKKNVNLIKEDRYFSSDRKPKKDRLKTATVYQMEDDLLNDEERHKSAPIKIIDMTGPNQKVFEGYHQLYRNKDNNNKDEFDDILNQRNVLIEMDAQDEPIDNRERLHEELDELFSDQKNTQNIFDYDSKQLESMKLLVDNLKSIVKIDCDQDKLLNLIETIAKDPFLDNFLVEDVIRSFVFPIVQILIKSWSPIDQPDTHRLFFSEIKKRLQSKTYCQLYELLIYEHWYPIVRQSVINLKSMKDSQSIINVLECWKQLIPHWLLNEFLDEIILKRLINEVDEWKKTDAVSIHIWIHPWLIWFADRDLDQCLFAPVRQKIGQELKNWHPSDSNPVNVAKLILQPWRNVFKLEVWDSFIRQHICSKLNKLMIAYEINPIDQNWDVWRWFIDWEDLAPAVDLVAILENHFFPKWLRVLYDWLRGDPNYDEICEWYLEWKMYMPSNWLLDQPIICQGFTVALAMMDHAISDPFGISSYSLKTDTKRTTTSSSSSFSSAGRSFYSSSSSTRPSLANLNFRQLVETRAAELGILFIPLVNRLYEGKQLYQFGKLIIFFDKNVIFTCKDSVASPIAIQSLIDACQ